MQSNVLIEQLYKILLLFEDAVSADSLVSEKDYLGYLDRVYVYWLGVGCSDIYYTIKGLRTLGLEADHKVVKSMVFHMISVAQKEGDSIVV